MTKTMLSELKRRLLEISDLAAIGKPFDRLDKSTVRLHGQRQAGTHDLTVDAHGAGATYPVLAADMCASELEVLAQEVRKIQARQHLRFDAFAIDMKRDRQRRGHARPPPPGPERSRSFDTQRASKTFARCRRIAPSACWSASGSSS